MNSSLNGLCAPKYQSCPIQGPNSPPPLDSQQVSTADKALHRSNPFKPPLAPSAQNPECGNYLILTDVEMRRQAKVRPLDCSLYGTYSYTSQLPPQRQTQSGVAPSVPQ
jgi:hypothetical protein